MAASSSGSLIITLKALASYLRHEILPAQPDINEPSPISTIPVEILLHIFEFVAYTEKPKIRNLGWIRAVTHVCRLWRHAALGCPSLWANICTSIGPKWTEEMFRRSSSVYLDIDNPSSDWKTDLTLSHRLEFTDTMLNVRTLNLSASCTILYHLRIPAPSLCTLVVNAQRVKRPADLLSLPWDLFAYHAPKLRHASFRYCRIPWESPIFNDSLSTLSVGPGSFWGEVAYNLSSLCGLLERTPLLEVLDACITDTFPSIHHPSSLLTDGGQVNPIPLPQLTTIRFKGGIVECLRLLRRITFPATAHTNLICWPSFDDVLSLYDMTPFLVDRIEDVYRDLPLRELSIRCNLAPRKKPTLCISLFVAIPISGMADTRHHAFFLEFVFPPPFQVFELLKVICRALPAQHVNDLLVLDFSGRESTAFENSLWVDLFWEMRNIHRLEVSSLSTLAIPTPYSRCLIPLDITRRVESEQVMTGSDHELGSTGEPSSTEGSSPIPIFPALQSLTISSVQLPDAKSLDPVLRFCEKLAWVVEFRKSMGVPLQELKVVFYDPTRWFAAGFLGTPTFDVVKKRLEKSVSNVIFDSVHTLQ